MWVEISHAWHLGKTASVILFVRMWVEMFSIHWVTLKWNVILFVRMWVEIVIRNAITDNRNGHPLREDVSWNIRALEEAMLKIVVLFVRMWVEMSNGELQSNHHKVILFVRMWVEISLCTDVVQDFLSSSSWGCELKCLLFLPLFFEIYRHPLREDVSWNALLLTVVVLDAPVILFVRMWVEITDCFAAFKTSAGHPLREDVSWNLEEYGVNHRCSNMVLLVGRWIEIFLIVFLSFAWRSHYYTSFNLNIKLNYRNLRGNFYMCS